MFYLPSDPLFFIKRIPAANIWMYTAFPKSHRGNITGFHCTLINSRGLSFREHHGACQYRAHGPFLPISQGPFHWMSWCSVLKSTLTHFPIDFAWHIGSPIDVLPVGSRPNAAFKVIMCLISACHWFRPLLLPLRCHWKCMVFLVCIYLYKLYIYSSYMLN